ncbi:polyketide cyclase [Sandaracinobacter neustonicus]|uniref:Polyketide cyclase n=1 Tax=Sandaracinobacter neustonicus TaxID=1715348 RepID=A0A501XQ02_9SPHN|nr:polyketide cyclase [Sandaracinobacter neustonicus]
MPFDPALDLKLVRDVEASPEALWRGWTDVDLLKQWFCPKPWRVIHAELDLRPGGIFHSVMQGPNGERHEGPPGCYLEVVPHSRLSWTDALGPGFRPNAQSFMSATIGFDPLPGGSTRYTAVAYHATAETRQTHLEMGFEAGWNAALDQLLELLGPSADKG